MSTLENQLNRNMERQGLFKNMNSLMLRYGVVVAFIVVVGLSAILYPGFLRPANLVNIFSQLAIVGIMSIGMTFVMITGGLDMSVGGIYALCATLIASYADSMPLPVAFAITLVVGLAAGLINGVLVTRLRVPPFVATLGTGSVFTGIALIYSNAQPFFVQKESFQWMGSGELGAIPIAVFLLFLVYVVGAIVLAFTTYGRSLYALGGNKEASRLSGLRVNWLISSTYGLSGLCAAVSGILIASRLGQGQANIGETIALDVIAAVVIGGTSLSGGEGAIWRTIVGGCILAVLSNVFDSLSLSPYWQSVFKGCIIIGAVMFDYYARTKTQT
ncbi:ABC transporter permease [Paenibacillus sp. Leaf72]|uniref:ABC transporter permease n=1 Tax=Paenibacillus sp. Leaf72 TaxID=1736234 RepID=UPI000AE26A87|nr:ABC transporter permease [Paenibacillus sp. Leaf72]